MLMDDEWRVLRKFFLSFIRQGQGQAPVVAAKLGVLGAVEDVLFLCSGGKLVLNGRPVGSPWVAPLSGMHSL
jgi:hypothetical protein